MMSVGEASAANTVARALLRVPSGFPLDKSPDAVNCRPPADEDILHALVVLLDGAYRKLHAGLDGTRVAEYRLRKVDPS